MEPYGLENDRDNPDQPELVHANRVHHYPRRIAATFLVASIVVSGAGEYYADDPLIGPRHLFDIAFNYGADPVDPEISTLIDRLADAPSPPEFTEFMDKASDIGTPTEDLDGDGMIEYGSHDDLRPGQPLFEDLYFGYCQSKAETYGLHLPDPYQFEAKVQDAESVDEVLDALNEYGETLGVHVVTHEATDLRDIGFGITPFQPERFTLDDNLRKGVIGLMGAMAYIPKEVYEYLDIKEIRLVEKLGEIDNVITGPFEPAGEANPATGILYLPRAYLSDGGFELIMHEIGHRFDYRSNGNSIIGATRDQVFVGLNQDGFEYGVDPGEDNENITDPYAATNAWEDKARLLQVMMNGLSGDYLNSDNPIIKAKYRELLYRLEAAVPGYGQYLLAISYHEPLY